MKVLTSDAQVHPSDWTEPRKTAPFSPESNSMAVIFVKMIKRDDISIMEKPDEAMAVKILAEALEHYNEWHPHRALLFYLPVNICADESITD